MEKHTLKIYLRILNRDISRYTKEEITVITKESRESR